MIVHPFKKQQEVTARKFAKRYVEKKLWEIADNWKSLSDPAVVAEMSDDERRGVSEEIFHLVRMIELHNGLVEEEDVTAKWRGEGDGEAFELMEKHSHPGTRVRLARILQEPDKYAVQLINAGSGEFIQSQKSFALQAAMEVAVSMAFNENWLSKIGVPKTP